MNKMKTLPVIGQTYEIRYLGYYDYDKYFGTGIYTGEIDEDEEGPFYGFDVGVKETCWFPLDSIFPTDV